MVRDVHTSLQENVDSSAEVFPGYWPSVMEASQELQTSRACFHIAKTTSSTANDSRYSPALYCERTINYWLLDKIIYDKSD